MATESQWRAVIQAMAEAANEDPLVLIVFRDGSGRCGHSLNVGNLHGGFVDWPHANHGHDPADQALRELGIPIDPDPAPELEAQPTFPVMYLVDISGIIRHGQKGDADSLNWHAFKICDLLEADGHKEQAERLRRIIRREGNAIRLAGAEEGNPNPAPPAPRLSEEGRAELLAQFTAAALTGLTACGYNRGERRADVGEHAADYGKATLAAFEAALEGKP